MPFPALQKYLVRLPATPQAATSVWLDRHGRATGRYFNSTLTSAFQAIRAPAAQQIVGFEGFARSHSNSDSGLSLWKLLDHAASDDESIALDRLCRMLHAINFFRQPQAAHTDLYLSVHARLLAGVSANHGNAFRRVLDSLELPHEKIVLQLPLVAKHQNWLLAYVADNYRRNGFRLAVNAADAGQALALLDALQPEAIKVDAREIPDPDAALHLLQEAGRRGVRLIFKRVETEAVAATLHALAASAGQTLLTQGFLRDLPAAALATSNTLGTTADLPAAPTLRASAAA
ncbi:EAL domain-containing protein [Herminiimonas sp. CN]|uniref:EAL domain-containing protein n=1 Tax=Herminiimonas sp. CN TaxID=1349818 RepID=UPI0004743BF1|nr:EAL domain-containing protein [Herminiimonas sp. CN]